MATKRALAERFKGIGPGYDRTRPSYPEEVIATIVKASGISEKSRLLEIGAGTGIATARFAAKGFSIMAVEPMAGMLAEARKRTMGLRVRYLCRRFEHAGLPEESFDLVFSAQAYHWLDKRTRVKRTAAFLKEGGTLALFWNQQDGKRSAIVRQRLALRDRLRTSAYRGIRIDYAKEMQRLRTVYVSVIKRVFHWEKVYTQEQYFALERSMSWVDIMSRRRKALYFAELENAVGKRDRIVIPYRTLLILARKGR